MPIAPNRRFTLIDAMYLVAVTGLGVAWNRSAMKDYATFNYAWIRSSSVIRMVNLAIWILVPHLVLWSFALLALALGRHRRPIRETARQPGLAACWAAAAAALLEGLWYVPFKLSHPNGLLPGIMVVQHSQTASFAVIGAWVVLAIGDRLEADRSWIEVVGRLLGAGWISVIVALRLRDFVL